MKIILATGNPSKAEQIRALFLGPLIEIVTLDEAGITGGVQENGETLKDNALKKALFAYEHCHDWSMADDTGIFITALDGLPGVRSARWAGDGATEEQTMLYALRELEGKSDRSAKFATVVAVISPIGKQYFFTGEVLGRVLESPRMKPQPKMPYSSIFVPNGAEKVWAEMTVDEENAISHRGQAFRQAKEFLEGFARQY